MTKFGKIKEVISEYQKQADKHYSSYKAREAEARQKFSEAGFVTEFRQKMWPKMAGDAWSNADFAINKVMELFDETEEELKKFVMRPLDASMIQVLNCIDSFGLRLSLSELKIIESSARESYWGIRIFTGLAQKSGYQVNVPTVDSYQKALETARSNAKLAIRAYAGSPDEGYPGKDLLQKWENKGSVMGEYQHYHTFFAANFLHEGGELDRLEEMWGEARAPMVYRLNEREAEQVKKVVGNIMHDGEVDKKAAQELIKKDPDFKDKLQSMPDNFFEGKEALVNHFRLNEKEEKEESLITPGSRKAAEYGANRFQRVDAETLKQFE